MLPLESSVCVYSSPVTWEAPEAPFADGAGNFFSVRIGANPASLAATAAVAIPVGAEAAIFVSTGRAATGVRAAGLAGGAALQSSLTRPLSAQGYAFDLLFSPPDARVRVRIPAGTLVAGPDSAPSDRAAASPSNEVDLWIAVSRVSPAAGVITADDTWFVANASLPSFNLSLVAAGNLALLRQSIATSLGLDDLSRVIVTGISYGPEGPLPRSLRQTARFSGDNRRLVDSNLSASNELFATILVITTDLNASTCSLLSPTCALSAQSPCVDPAVVSAGNATVSLAAGFVQLAASGKLLGLWASEVRLLVLLM